MKSSILFLLVSACFSCTGNLEKESISAPTSPSEPKLSAQPVKSKLSSLQDTVGLDSLWHSLVFDQGGCLTGGQYVVNGHFGGKGCVMTENRQADWRPFFNYSKDDLTEFLIAQFSDTTSTKIHTCPYQIATTGEVAVYCLSKIHSINWYDFKPFISYQKREGSGSADCPQSWLHAILEDPEKRKLLISEWRKL